MCDVFRVSDIYVKTKNPQVNTFKHLVGILHVLRGFLHKTNLPSDQQHNTDI